jgi:hypothetical protein
MFCPECRYEYKTGVTTCPDCGATMVATLPEKDPENEAARYQNWVHVARLTSSISAQMLLDVLRSKNIPAVILSGSGHFGQTGQMGPSSFRPIDGAYSLMVPQEFVSDADAEAEALLGDEWKKARLIDT